LFVDDELEFLVFVLFGLSKFECLFGEDDLEGSAFEGLVFVFDDYDVVAAGGDALAVGIVTVSMGKLIYEIM